MAYRMANGMQRPSNSYYATDRQVWYLRLLLNEAFAARYTHGTCYDPNHLNDRMPRADVSAAIDTLVKAKRNGWK